MAFKLTKKEELLEKIRNLGCEEEFISWLRPRYTNERLQKLIENDEALGIITRVAIATGRRDQ